MTAQAVSPERKTALVTGASSGIGEAFAEVPCRPAVRSRDHRAARGAAPGRRGSPQRAARHTRGGHPVRSDDRGRTRSTLRRDRSEGLTIDALVNCAGFGVPGSYTAAAWNSHQAMLQLLVSAPCELTHRLLPAMITRGYGRIINVASTAGVAALPAGTMYGAAKTMLVRFSESLAREVAPHGVHVTAICPGLHNDRVPCSAGHARDGCGDAALAMDGAVGGGARGMGCCVVWPACRCQRPDQPAAGDVVSLGAAAADHHRRPATCASRPALSARPRLPQRQPPVSHLMGQPISYRPSRVLYICYASPMNGRLGPARRHHHMVEQLSRFYDLHVLSIGVPSDAMALARRFGNRVSHATFVEPARSAVPKHVRKLWRTLRGACDFLPPRAGAFVGKRAC